MDPRFTNIDELEKKVHGDIKRATIADIE